MDREGLFAENKILLGEIRIKRYAGRRTIPGSLRSPSRAIERSAGHVLEKLMICQEIITSIRLRTMMTCFCARTRNVYARGL